MRIIIIAVFWASHLLFAGFRVSAASGDETFIRNLLADQSAAWNRGDGAAWTKDFAEDADFVNLRGDVLRGPAEISQKVIRALNTTFKGSQLTITIRLFRLLTPDAAIIDTNYDLSGVGTLAPGIRPITHGTLKTRMKYIALKRKGHWRFVSAQNTAIVGGGKR